MSNELWNTSYWLNISCCRAGFRYSDFAQRCGLGRGVRRCGWAARRNLCHWIWYKLVWKGHGISKAKKYKPERIVNLLRKTEAVVANGKTHPANPSTFQDFGRTLDFDGLLSGKSSGHYRAPAEVPRRSVPRVGKAPPIGFRPVVGLRQQALARFEPLPVEQWPESIIHRFLQVLLAPEVTLCSQN